MSWSTSDSRQPLAKAIGLRARWGAARRSPKPVPSPPEAGCTPWPLGMPPPRPPPWLGSQRGQAGSRPRAGSPLQVAPAAHAPPDSRDHPGGCRPPATAVGRGNARGGSWSRGASPFTGRGCTHKLDLQREIWPLCSAGRGRARAPGMAKGRCQGLLGGLGASPGAQGCRQGGDLGSPCPTDGLGARGAARRLRGTAKGAGAGGLQMHGVCLGAHPQQQRPHSFTAHGARPRTSTSPGTAFPSRCPGSRGADNFTGISCELQEPLSFGISGTVSATDWLRLLRERRCGVLAAQTPTPTARAGAPRLCGRHMHAHSDTDGRRLARVRTVSALRQGHGVPCCPHPPAWPRGH